MSFAITLLLMVCATATDIATTCIPCASRMDVHTVDVAYIPLFGCLALRRLIRFFLPRTLMRVVHSAVIYPVRTAILFCPCVIFAVVIRLVAELLRRVCSSHPCLLEVVRHWDGAPHVPAARGTWIARN